MAKKIFLLSVFGFLFLAVARPAAAQFSRMTGTVIAEDGTPLANAVVTIDREDVRGHYEVKTDKNGKFFHSGLPLGRYKVAVVMGGKEVFSLQNIQTRSSEPANVEINLQQERMRTEAQAAGIDVGDQAGKLTPEQMAEIEKAAAEREAEIQKRQQLVTKFGSAMEALKAKQYDAAIPSLQAAAEVDPTQHVVFAQLGEAYSGKAAETRDAAQKKELFTKASENYKKAIELKPDDASYHNNFALALANNGQVPEAQAELVKAAELDPPNAGQYFFNLGAVLVNTGSMEGAVEAFRRATAANPQFADAYYQLGVTLIGMATVDPKTGAMVPPEGTQEALEKYVELAPTGPNAAAAKSLLETMGSAVTTKVGGK
jgi:tetratricopeptide (TPR) repeat protein